MDIVIIRIEKVHIVVTDDWKFQLSGEADKQRIDVILIRYASPLQFDEETWFSTFIASERVCVPLGFSNSIIPMLLEVGLVKGDKQLGKR